MVHSFFFHLDKNKDVKNCLLDDDLNSNGIRCVCEEKEKHLLNKIIYVNDNEIRLSRTKKKNY